MLCTVELEYEPTQLHVALALSFYRRAFSSGNVDGACAVLNNARWVWPQGGCGLELFIKLGLPPQLTAADGVQESAAPEAAGLLHCHWVSQATLCSKVPVPFPPPPPPPAWA